MAKTFEVLKYMKVQKAHSDQNISTVSSFTTNVQENMLTSRN